MKMKMTRLVLIASLLAPAGYAGADESTAKETIKHPVKAYDEQRVKSNAEDAVIYEQKMKETKAELEQAQRDLASSNSQEVREQAQKRVNSLQKEYNKLAKKAKEEKRELNEAKQDLEQDKREIKQEANQ